MASVVKKAPPPSKKPFSKFNLDDAYRSLKIRRLLPWNLQAEAIEPSATFKTYLKRIQNNFDLTRSEDSKKLVVDLIFIEAIEPFPNLKVWKGGRLESDIAKGAADYLITENMGYIASPMLCVVEAKKDDFEQGLAQCLVEMQACQWNNQQEGRSIDILGIVTNGDSWQFYKLTTMNKVYETPRHDLINLPIILGILNTIFQDCDKSLNSAE
jgi:serine protease inhibitor ecotin